MATGLAIKLAPLAAWMVVQPRPIVQDVTKGGLHRVDLSKEKPQTGIVLEVGPDVDQSRVPVGAIVLYSKFAGTEVDLGDYEVVMLQQADLLAVVELTEVELEDEPPVAAESGLVEVASR